MFENVLKAKPKREEKTRLIKPSKERWVNKLTSNRFAVRGGKSGCISLEIEEFDALTF